MGNCSASTWQTLPTYSSSRRTSVTGVRTRRLPEGRRRGCRVLTAVCFVQGNRFHYTYYDESQGEIYRSIEHLDKMVSW